MPNKANQFNKNIKNINRKILQDFCEVHEYQTLDRNICTYSREMIATKLFHEFKQILRQL